MTDVLQPICGQSDQLVHSKDPLNSMIIPEIVEEKRKDSEGRIIINKYIRGKLLGKGGFAKVFVGITPANHQYALKIVSRSSLVKLRAKQKFQTEIKIHKSLRHNHVVRFERCFEDCNNCYIVMELCANNSMSELLKRRKKITEPESRYYMKQLIHSMQYLHSNLVIHRDLKLGNLFLDCDLRIKVGDFGLATKLVHVDERRKTICGTPNYIAPEILEGKEGHSFEVDTWAIGVILYTLLIGKPPFESKDVKSTYKRILTNTFTFPDHTPICSHAKNLIRMILQTNPSSRPSLNTILDHSFFSRPTAYTPDVLPESCLRETPSFPQITNTVGHLNKFETRQVVAPSGGKYNPTIPFGDENDPAAANRLKPNTIIDLTKEAPAAIEKGRTLANREDLHKPFHISPDGKQNPFNNIIGSSNPNNLKPTHQGLARGGAVHDGKVVSNVIQPSRPISAPKGTNTFHHGDRGYSKRFEIYQDKVSESNEVKVQKPVYEHAKNPFGPVVVESNRIDVNLDKMLIGMENVTIQGKLGKPVVTRPPEDNAVGNDRKLRRGSKDSGVRYTSDENQTKKLSVYQEEGLGLEQKVPESNHIRDAWAWEEDQHVQVTAKEVMKTDVQFPAMDQSKSATNIKSVRNQVRKQVSPPSGDSHQPMVVCTPTDQVVTTHEMLSKKQGGIGTLEAMHEMLNSSFSSVDQFGLSGHDHKDPLDDIHLYKDQLRNITATKIPSHKLVAKVWVSRYVDYTSKYGLGFIFNTGSAGVYFNDSTKIVLSADGKVFQYFERKRRESIQSSSPNDNNVCQTHLITAYPMELQKKVTLLKHFRNYLMDQEKGTDVVPNGVKENQAVAMSLGAAPIGNAGTGATNSIPLGASTVHFGVNAYSNEEDQMPFLKKWVRTKHAILFRISNRTVQVVFYDHSEVLLSSEAKIITYVNKLGMRTENSLDDILHGGRVDIAKRLKYTKDIMFRLIHNQAK